MLRIQTQLYQETLTKVWIYRLRKSHLKNGHVSSSHLIVREKWKREIENNDLRKKEYKKIQVMIIVMTDSYVAKTWSVQVVPVASRCSTPAVLELRDSASHQAGGLTGCPAAWASHLHEKQPLLLQCSLYWLMILLFTQRVKLSKDIVSTLDIRAAFVLFTFFGR